MFLISSLGIWSITQITHFSNNPVEVYQNPPSASIPQPCNLVPGCKSPLVFAVLGIEPSSIMRLLFPYCNSFWIKYPLSTNCCPALVFFDSRCNGRPQINRSMKLRATSTFCLQFISITGTTPVLCMSCRPHDTGFKENYKFWNPGQTSGR